MALAPAISVRGLRKAYGNLVAVDGLDLEVARGEVFALLGPNGAGKTTTVEILEGYRQPDAGEVAVLGMDPWTGGSAYRSRIGIVLQEAGVYPYLSAREALRLFAGYYPSPRSVDEVIGLVGLEEHADRRVRALSGGQARRLDVALALVGRPELIFLDEPTTGFDPSARRAAWDVIGGLAADGTTVLLTTHYLDEARALAHRVGVMRNGRLAALGTPEELVSAGRRTEVRFALPDGADPAALAALAGGTLSSAARDRVAIAVDEPTRALHALTSWALEGGATLDELEVVRPSLEDVYLDLTRDAAPEAVAP